MSAKNQYIEDRQYLIDKSSNPDKKKESLGMEFDRRVEDGKIIVKNGKYSFRKATAEEKEDIDAINKMMKNKNEKKETKIEFIPIPRGDPLIGKRGVKKLTSNFAEGGMVSKKKLAGRLAKRGYGAAKK